MPMTPTTPSRPSPGRTARTNSTTATTAARAAELLGVVARRLRPQRLLGARFERPEDVVGWLGAVQSQDYLGAKWAVAQRTSKPSDADFEDAFTRGAILRTHVLRPTWHFVAPADIR